jgi:hypothetical protein
MKEDRWSLKGKKSRHVVDRRRSLLDIVIADMYLAEDIETLRLKLIKDLTAYFIDDFWMTNDKKIIEKESKKRATEIINKRFGTGKA